MISKFRKYVDTSITFLVFFLILFITSNAYAQAGLNNNVNVSAQTMIANITQQLPNLMRMVTALAYVMGMVFIVFGILKLKQYGESRTMMSHDRQLLPAMVLIIIGSLLLYLPNTVQMGLSTFWANPNPYAYMQQKDQWNQILSDCFMIIQFFGTVAFIRGLVILSHLGSHQQGTLSRGLTHIIGGILCINIYQFVQVVLNTLGIQT